MIYVAILYAFLFIVQFIISIVIASKLENGLNGLKEYLILMLVSALFFPILFAIVDLILRYTHG